VTRRCPLRRLGLWVADSKSRDAWHPWIVRLLDLIRPKTRLVTTNWEGAKNLPVGSLVTRDGACWRVVKHKLYLTSPWESIEILVVPERRCGPVVLAL
jgi:hypothetical protein